METQKGSPLEDGNKVSEKAQGPQVTRRRFRDTAMTVPLLGFGCMRLPLSSSEQSKIDVAVSAATKGDVTQAYTAATPPREHPAPVIMGKNFEPPSTSARLFPSVTRSVGPDTATEPPV